MQECKKKVIMHSVHENGHNRQINNYLTLHDYLLLPIINPKNLK